MRRPSVLSAALNPGLRWLALSALLGAVSVFGYAPFYLFPLPILTLAVQTWLWHRARNAYHALALGYAFGQGYAVEQRLHGHFDAVGSIRHSFVSEPNSVA